MTTGRIHSIAQRTLALALLPAALALPAAAQARAGAVDRSYADHGRFQRWARPGQPWRSVLPGAVWAGGGGRTVVDGLGARRLDARGRPDRAFGSAGVVAGQLWPVPNGTWLLQTNTDPLPLDADGHLTPNAVAFAHAVGALDRSHDSQDQKFLVGLTDGTVLDVDVPYPGPPLSVAKLSLDGTLAAPALAMPQPPPFNTINYYTAAQSSAGAFVATLDGLLRFRADGTLDPDWGARGLAPAGSVVGVLDVQPWTGGGALILANDARIVQKRLIWLDGHGHVVRRRSLFALPAATSVRYRTGVAVATDPQGHVLVARTYDRDRGITLTRLRRDGATDTSFGTRGVVHLHMTHRLDVRGLVVQPDGRIVIAGALLRWGYVHDDRSDIASRGYVDAGTVVWRLRAR